MSLAPGLIGRYLALIDPARAGFARILVEPNLGSGEAWSLTESSDFGDRTNYAFTHMGDEHERNSSSGVIVSTGLGSTGWLKSVLMGAGRIAGGNITSDRQSILESGLPWDTESAVFSVREPYPSRRTQVDLTFGRIRARCELRLRSLMLDNGIIFSDGMEADGLEFKSGVEVRFGLSRQRGALLC